jgi:hypothetical protein
MTLDDGASGAVRTTTRTAQSVPHLQGQDLHLRYRVLRVLLDNRPGSALLDPPEGRKAARVYEAFYIELVKSYPRDSLQLARERYLQVKTIVDSMLAHQTNS